MNLRLAFLALLIAGPLSAQRSLHWSEIQVDASLAADGTLHVKERQTIVFTGDWNGGERRFDVRPRQRFEFLSLGRLDSTGLHVLQRCDLSQVDCFGFSESRTLRWRSRLPTDPPFKETPITYVLDYTISNVLVPEGDRWLLDHDFAFPDRGGVIDRFSVRLSLDPAWKPDAPFVNTFQGTNLPPGEGFIVRVPVAYVGPGEGPAVAGANPVERGLIALVVLLILASLARRLYTHEKTTGRLDPLPAADVDRKWLEENVFARLPEVVGAAWDNNTGASEVAAVLARLVVEKRLKSEVQPGGLLGTPVLHLELLVDRSRFHDYEERLIDSLFESGERTTDTARIRERYKSSGFDPANKIRKPLEGLVKALAGGTRPSRSSPLPSLLNFALGVVLMGLAIARDPADAPVVFAVGAVTIVFYFFALGGAVAWRNRVHDVGNATLFFAIPLGIPLAVLLFLLASGFMQVSMVALAGLAFLFLSLANSVFNQARSKESLERIGLRRRLAVARAYFIDELRRDKPRLEDDWFPYLIAFGLGKHMDKWFEAFGAASPDPGIIGMSHSSGSSGRSGSTGGSGGWSGFGGGGGFSGGGASASWAAAAGTIASGVSAPSSGGGSSGGGGGGGGGSSGGGGGGGW